LLSYSRRVQRPDLDQLDPFRTVYDQFSSSQGNPALKPEQTQAFEATYQYRKGPTVYMAQGFARLNSAGFTDVTVSLGNNDFLDTQQNLTRSRDIGVEFDASGHIGKDWTYNVSASGYQKTIDASSLGFPTRSGFETEGHASITWQATPKDMFQLQSALNPGQLSPQGYSDGYAVLFLGYRRKVSDHLFLTATVLDAARSLHLHNVTDTPTLKGVNDFRPALQTVMFGFTYAFGSATKRDPSFDFNTN
jgi:hypothetical protein